MTQRQPVLVSVLAVLGLMLLASAPASAEGRTCPVDHGACFIGLGEQNFFTLSDGAEDFDNDGDVDYLVILFDGFNDFLRQNPDGSLSFHMQNREHALIYCPFNINDQFPPTDDCVFGIGRLQANGVLGGPLGACPGVVRMNGTGVRPADDAIFDFAGEFQVTASDCENAHKFSITAEEVD